MANLMVGLLIGPEGVLKPYLLLSSLHDVIIDPYLAIITY